MFYAIVRETFDLQNLDNLLPKIISDVIQYIDEGNILLELEYSNNIFMKNKIILKNKYDLWDIGTFKLLKNKGLNIHSQMMDTNKSLLCHIYERKYFEIVKFLVNNNNHENISKYENDYLKLLECACREDDYELVELLVNKDIDIHNKYNNTLWHAATYGRNKIIKFLLEKDVDINVTDHYQNALSNTAIHSHPETVKLLVENGANVNMSYNYSSPLCEAIKYGQTEIVKYLIQNGADLNDDFTNPLYNAVKYNNHEIIKFLIDSGSNVNPIYNWRDPDLDLKISKHPLYNAVKNHNFEIVKLLVENGANVNIYNYYKSFILEVSINPLLNAIENNNYEIAKFLLENGADFDHVKKLQEFECYLYRYPEIIEKLENLKLTTT